MQRCGRCMVWQRARTTAVGCKDPSQKLLLPWHSTCAAAGALLAPSRPAHVPGQPGLPATQAVGSQQLVAGRRRQLGLGSSQQQRITSIQQLGGGTNGCAASSYDPLRAKRAVKAVLKKFRKVCDAHPAIQAFVRFDLPCGTVKADSRCAPGWRFPALRINFCRGMSCSWQALAALLPAPGPPLLILRMSGALWCTGVGFGVQMQALPS